MDRGLLQTESSAAAHLLPALFRAHAEAARTEKTETARALPDDRLDQAQRAIVELDSQRPVLILGGAGSGKTTVALHRLARLHQRDPRGHAQHDLLAILPEPGLAGWTAAALRDLGLGRIAALTFDEWGATQARRVFPELPMRVCAAPPAASVRLKRHPALRAVLPLFIERLGQQAAARLDRRLAGRGRLCATWDQLLAPTLRDRLDRLEQTCQEHTPALAEEVRAAFAAERARLLRVRADLFELFGDRALLAQAVARSGSELWPGMIADVVEHARVQSSQTSQEEFADIEEEFKRTLDGLGLDEGTPQEDAQTIDPEDYAVYFELLRRKTGALETEHGALRRYAGLLIDEAQEFAPIELGLLATALRPGGSLILCGDECQQVDPTARFQGWTAVLSELGAEPCSVIRLLHSYRCSAAVTRFSYAVLGPLAPQERLEADDRGEPVLLSRYDSEAEAAQAIAQALDQIVLREPALRVALIARRPGTAQRLHALLPRSLRARLLLSGSFRSGPGIQITVVSQVKGLEFDLVIVPDADAGTYDEDLESRRTLYVACTRARAQLWIVNTGVPSAIVHRSFAGMIQR